MFFLITLGLLSFSYKQILLVLLATAEGEAEPECLPRFSLLTPLKASSFPQGACKKLSLGSLQRGAVCLSSTETRHDGLPQLITNLGFYTYVKIIGMMCNIYTMAECFLVLFLFF